MLSKRVIVVAGDKPFQKRLVAGAMAAGGAVQAFASAEEVPARIEAELVLYALGWQTADQAFRAFALRLPEGCRLVPILPAPQLEGMVSLLGDPRIATVLVAEEMSTQSISSAVSKLLYGDLFGIEKVMPWGIRIYSVLVGDYQEKSLAIAAIGDFAQAMGVRRKFREQIDQCIDEMLMNALYDAPVDEDGRSLFADVPVKDRIGMRVAETAVVQYACDGDRFAVSVRDSFGSLNKAIVLKYLDKCLHASGAEQIDRKTGGAGLGLYLIANAATELYFHVFEGKATEVVCTFDLQSSRSQLRCFGFFEESLETANRPAGPARTIPTRRGRRHEDLVPPPRSSVVLPVMMTFAVLLLIAAVTLVALPYVLKKPKAALHIETDPPGATVYVDGRARGTAPVVVTDLEAGRSFAVRATLKGHHEEDQLVTATEGDSTVRLRLPAESGVAVIESDPAGAHLIIDGKDSGKISPATLELEAGKELTLSLRKDGFLEQRLAITGPSAGERAVYRASLPLSQDVAALTITSEIPDATVTVDGMALLPPSPSHDTFVKPGVVHKVKVSAPGYIDFREELQPNGGEHRTIVARLLEGGVFALKTNVVAKVLIDDKPVGTAPMAPVTLSNGRHTISLRNSRPFLRYSTTVEVQKGKTTESRIDFGTVEVKANGVAALPPGADAEGVNLLYLPVGAQKLPLRKRDSSDRREHDVSVSAGSRLVIDSF